MEVLVDRVRRHVDHVADLEKAVCHPPAGKRDDPANSNAADNLEDRIDLGASG